MAFGLSDLDRAVRLAVAACREELVAAIELVAHGEAERELGEVVLREWESRVERLTIEWVTHEPGESTS